MSLFKYAIVLHLFFGAWFYSNSNILSAQNLALLDVVRRKISENKYTAKVDAKGIFNRFESGIGLLYLLFIIVLLICFIFEAVAIALIKSIVSACHHCAKGDKTKET